MKRIVILIFLLGMTAAPAANTFRMLQSNVITGLIPDIEDGYGVAFRDFNKDRLPDIYLVCFRNLNRLLINNGGIVPFVDRTIFSGLGGNLMPRGKVNLELGASAADYDNDGLPDLFIAGWGKAHALFHNEGNLRFTDATGHLNLHGIVDANQGLWLDADNDGYLDLYITDEHHSNRFLHNEGNGYFDERVWTEEFVDSAVSQGGCVSDFDLDGDPDLYVCNWFAPDYLLLNDGNGLFTRASLNLTTLNNNISTNSATAADVDNDGDPDLLVAGHNGRVYVYRNDSRDGTLSFTPLTDLPFQEMANSVYGIVTADFNQDGWLDVFLSVKGENRMYLGKRGGAFSRAYDTDGHTSYSTGSAIADFDRDGDPDLFVANKNSLSQVYLNPVNNDRYLWLTLRGVRSNRDAVGAKVFLYAVSDTGQTLFAFREVQVGCGYLSSRTPSLHFGTGLYRTFQAKIVFPSGRVVTSGPLRAGQGYAISEYGRFLTALYSGYYFFKTYLSRPGFWLNFLLVMLLLGMVVLFVKKGLQRYRWSNTEVSTGLISWSILLVLIFIALRNLSMARILLLGNVFTLGSILLVVVYSEGRLQQRRKHRRYRQALQKLSSRMITIHDDHQLYRELTDAIQSHDEIRNVRFLTYQEQERALRVLSGSGQAQIFPLRPEQEQALTASPLIDRKQDALFGELFDGLGANILLTIRQEERLLAVLALQMDNTGRAVNREDLLSLIPIANQMAIAMENNRFIREHEKLVQQLTEARIRQEYLKQLEETNRQLDQKNTELTRLFKELQEKETQLIQSEKMASLGHLVAGISHELNNPISFIYANTRALEEYSKELRRLLQEAGSGVSERWQARFNEILNDIQTIIQDNIAGSQSVKELVLNLKNFSRLDQAQWKEVSLVEGLETSLKILKPQMPESIEVVREFEADPPVYCNAGQMNQVFVNIISNALQAMGDSGVLTLRTRQQGGRLEISISDTGKGIPPDVVSKIFDPFFTTKEINQGTGLGLSISYSIVKKHNGEIEVDSSPGKGTTFILKIPIRQSK